MTNYWNFYNYISNTQASRSCWLVIECGGSSSHTPLSPWDWWGQLPRHRGSSGRGLLHTSTHTASWWACGWRHSGWPAGTEQWKVIPSHQSLSPASLQLNCVKFLYKKNVISKPNVFTCMCTLNLIIHKCSGCLSNSSFMISTEQEMDAIIWKVTIQTVATKWDIPVPLS